MNWGAAYYPFQILIGELPGNVVHKALRFAPTPSFTKQSGHMSQTTRSHVTNMWSHVTNIRSHVTNIRSHVTNIRSHVTNMRSHVTNMWSHVTNNPVTCHTSSGHMSHIIRSHVTHHPVTCHTSFHTIAPNIHPYILSFHSHCKSFLTFFSFLHHINREKFITIFILRNRWWTEAWPVYLNTNPFSHTTLMRSSDAPSQTHRKPIANPSQTHRTPLHPTFIHTFSHFNSHATHSLPFFILTTFNLREIHHNIYLEESLMYWDAAYIFKY
jgi:hypothetical protein